MTTTILQADAAALPFEDKSFDLVFGSPPYSDARTYGINAQRGCQDWIDWMLTVTREAVRVSRGLVLWICAGVTRKHCYWPGPEGLLYEWWKSGGQCWRPAYWHRDGIPGSGGKQWLRANIEYVLAFTGCKKAIPWADNTANGHPPKFSPGGQLSHRTVNGERVSFNKTVRRGNRTKAVFVAEVMEHQNYTPPTLANPGCLVKGIKVGGGALGHPLAHENEAPFPLKLAAWFVRSWCPPCGTVLDPFMGSGTTLQAAVELGRNATGCDIRQSQCELAERRLRGAQAGVIGAKKPIECEDLPLFKEA